MRVGRLVPFRQADRHHRQHHGSHCDQWWALTGHFRSFATGGYGGGQQRVNLPNEEYVAILLAGTFSIQEWCMSLEWSHTWWAHVKLLILQSRDDPVCFRGLWIRGAADDVRLGAPHNYPNPPNER